MQHLFIVNTIDNKSKFLLCLAILVYILCQWNRILYIHLCKNVYQIWIWDFGFFVVVKLWLSSKTMTKDYWKLYDKYICKNQSQMYAYISKYNFLWCENLYSKLMLWLSRKFYDWSNLYPNEEDIWIIQSIGSLEVH